MLDEMSQLRADKATSEAQVRNMSTADKELETKVEKQKNKIDQHRNRTMKLEATVRCHKTTFADHEAIIDIHQSRLRQIEKRAGLAPHAQFVLKYSLYLTYIIYLPLLSLTSF